MTDKKGNNMIPHDILFTINWCLAQMSSESLHLATKGNRIKTHRQILGATWETLWRRKERTVGARGVEGTKRKPTESINPGVTIGAQRD